MLCKKLFLLLFFRLLTNLPLIPLPPPLANDIITVRLPKTYEPNRDRSQNISPPPGDGTWGGGGAVGISRNKNEILAKLLDFHKILTFHEIFLFS